MQVQLSLSNPYQMNDPCDPGATPCFGMLLPVPAEWAAAQGLQDPRYAAKKARIEHLYAIADREVTPEAGEPEVIFCVDEFGPLNLQPRPGRHWAAIGGKGKEPGRAPRPRLRATYTRTAGVRHLFAPMSWARTSCTGISSRARPGPGSWSSAATCAACTRSLPGSRSSAITSART